MSTRSGVRVVTVGEDHAGRRLDNYLTWLLKDVPKSRIYRLVRRGEVRINGGRAKQDRRLQVGDCVRIPPLDLADKAAAANLPSRRLRQLLAESICFEDDQLLVINKPSGVAVHGGSGIDYGVIELLRLQRPESPYLELVHRLDRDTSGCLMIAKEPRFLRHVQALMRGGDFIKRYLTLVAGRWQGQERRIDLALARNVLRSGERLVGVSQVGKAALTLAEPVQVFSKASLLRVRLITGRTHQIRVHLATVGHPIAGDQKYGDAAFNHYMREFGLRTLFLHACQLAFGDKEIGRYDIECPMDGTQSRILHTLAGAMGEASNSTI